MGDSDAALGLFMLSVVAVLYGVIPYYTIFVEGNKRNQECGGNNDEECKKERAKSSKYFWYGLLYTIVIWGLTIGMFIYSKKDG